MLDRFVGVLLKPMSNMHARRISRLVPSVAAQIADSRQTVRFSVKRKLKYGENVKLIGNHPSLGSWDLQKAPSMSWNEGHIWTTEVEVPSGTSLEFKCVQCSDSGDCLWEDGGNHAFDIAPGKEYTIGIEWSKSASNESSGQSQVQEAEPSFRKQGLQGVMSEPMVNGWQGKEIKFMRSNEHIDERSGHWRSDHLQGTAKYLVEADRESPSWLTKLAATKAVLVDQAKAMRPGSEALACVYIYLTWVASGAIECVEGGGHRRPCAHADLSKMIFRSLEWVAGSSADVSLLARRLQTRLPSFSGEFTQSTPLTRIRDIAHRNDIPQWLKQEIKHTIQNKLHRNAGPEDLVATEVMLGRITAQPGEFPDAFISEFKIFVGELRDFFNAASLTDLLVDLRPGLDDASAQILDVFARAKQQVDSGEVDDNQLMDALHSATSVRALLISGLSSGLRTDAPDSALVMRQRWRLTEVRLEDYVFVLLSQFVNKLEERGGASALSSGSDGAWGLPLGALVVGLRHLGLSGFDPGECMAIECELAAWQRVGAFNMRDNALRLRATLLRLRRLTDRYSELLLSLFAERAIQMGSAFGLDAEQAAVFAESEIRSSIVFQLSKLSSLLASATADVAGTNPWDVIVAGFSRGVLLSVDSLEPGCMGSISPGKNAILLLKEATGDEEVSTLGPQLKGILLKQEIPHLSHLGVRARQESIPFAACTDDRAIEAMKKWEGKEVDVYADPTDGLSVDEAGKVPLHTFTNGAAADRENNAGIKLEVVSTNVDTSHASKVIPLQEATFATCGAKASICGALLRLAHSCAKDMPAGSSFKNAFFEAPDGICIPFGTMEAVLKSSKKLSAYEGMLKDLEIQLKATQGGVGGGIEALDALCSDIQGVLRAVRIPQSLLMQIVGAFSGQGDTVIVRSSANVEDLAGLSAAGLYDSIPNVSVHTIDSVETAVRGVWGSLFSRRAVLARYAAKIPQRDSEMAVVIQEQISPSLSFVLHTTQPLTRDKGVLSAELAPGFGETLASGTRGSGWRLEIDKSSADVKTLAFANFSQAQLPNANGSCVESKIVDYSRQELSQSEDVRTSIGRRLTAVGCLLESEFGDAQDIEGCFVDNQLWVVQTRPQP